MSDERQIEWHGRADFAEIAEVLKVPTNAIMAAMNPQSNETLVLFSPDVDEQPTTIFATTLRRSVDGTLFIVEQPREVPGLWADIVKGIERDLPGRLKQLEGEDDVV